MVLVLSSLLKRVFAYDWSSWQGGRLRRCLRLAWKAPSSWWLWLAHLSCSFRLVPDRSAEVLGCVATLMQILRWHMQLPLIFISIRESATPLPYMTDRAAISPFLSQLRMQ